MLIQQGSCDNTCKEGIKTPRGTTSGLRKRLKRRVEKDKNLRMILLLVFYYLKGCKVLLWFFIRFCIRIF